MSLSIRGYRQSDYPAIKEILVEAGMFHDVRDSEKNLRSISSSILVAVDEEIAGCIYALSPGWEGLLFRLAVRKNHRNRGIGSALLKCAEQHLQEVGVKQVALSADATDEDLIKFYVSRDYARSEHEYVWMWKRLSGNKH